MRAFPRLCMDCELEFSAYSKKHKRCKLCATHQYALERYGDLSDRPCQVCKLIFQPTKSTQKFCVSCGKQSARTKRAHWAKPAYLRHMKHVCTRYKLSMEEYNKLMNDSYGECGVCARTDLELVVDHDHLTNKVRGLTCMGCNTAIGYYERLTPSQIDRIKHYLG